MRNVRLAWGELVVYLRKYFPDGKYPQEKDEILKMEVLREIRQNSTTDEMGENHSNWNGLSTEVPSIGVDTPNQVIKWFYYQSLLEQVRNLMWQEGFWTHPATGELSQMILEVEEVAMKRKRQRYLKRTNFF